MNTCDACKWWKLGQTALGDCSCPKFLLGYSPKDTEALPDGVRVENDEGWGFATAPKFGCIHWKPQVSDE
jgi:hypothetical protein